MVRFDNNWQRKFQQPSAPDYVHLDANGRVTGRSMSASSYNQAVGLELFLLFVLWPVFLFEKLTRRWPGDIGKVKATLVVSALFPALAFLFGALGQDLRQADPSTYWSMYVVTSMLVWAITAITWVVQKVARWVKYGVR